MKVYEIILEGDSAVKKLGRAFNHLEDLVFFYGSAGTLEALNHIKEIATEEGAKTIRMKWDGCLHEDTILKTNIGDLTIKEVIKLHESDSLNLKVYGKDLKIDQDILTEVLGTSISVGIKKWVELTLENGSTVKLTEDHEVLTSNRGWVAAGNLITEDNIVEMK